MEIRIEDTKGNHITDIELNEELVEKLVTHALLLPENILKYRNKTLNEEDIIYLIQSSIKHILKEEIKK